MLPIHRLPGIDPAALGDAPPATIDLWCFFYDGAQAPLLASYRDLLCDTERLRYQALLFERDRLLFLATRALLRTALSHYLPIAPRDWRFAANEHGKPHIDNPGSADLRFNVSNTPGLAVCAITRTRAQLGVDTEWLLRRGETTSLAGRYFSASETAALMQLPAEDRHSQFFRYWTLKESYVKARGLGLSIPLDRFSFVLADEQPIRIRFDPRIDDDPGHWQFLQLTAGPAHVIAAAVGGCETPARFRSIRYVPLLGAQPFET